MRKCDIKNCDRKHFGKGYCKRHYHMMTIYGEIRERTMFDPNPIKVRNNEVEIFLCNAKGDIISSTIVDKKDYPKISEYKWYLRHGYVITAKTGKAMHSTILNTKSGEIVDHIDCNPLNNKMKNLRACQPDDNCKNSRIPKNNISGFKGVSWYKSTKRWVAHISVKNKKKTIGYFHNKLDAARAYNEAAVKYHGEFAKLNQF